MNRSKSVLKIWDMLCRIGILLLAGGLAFVLYCASLSLLPSERPDQITVRTTTEAEQRFGEDLLLNVFCFNNSTCNASYTLTLLDPQMENPEKRENWYTLTAEIHHRAFAAGTGSLQDSSGGQSGLLTIYFCPNEAADDLQQHIVLHPNSQQQNINGTEVRCLLQRDEYAMTGFLLLLEHNGYTYTYEHTFSGGYDPARHGPLFGVTAPDQPFAQAVYRTLACVLPKGAIVYDPTPAI